MIRFAVFLAICLSSLNMVHSAQQQVQLSDSYLPVAMQIIAHLTDQMAFEANNDVTPRPTTTTPKPTTTTRPTTTTTTPTWTTTTPTWTTTKPTWTTAAPTWTTTKPTWTTAWPTWTTTSWQYVTSKPASSSWWTQPTSSWWTQPTNSWWTKPTNSWNRFTTRRAEQTTPHHKPGLYAPYSPPKPINRFTWHPQQHRFVLLPVEPHAEYTILQPQETRTEEPLLSIQHEQIKPLVEPSPESAPYLPPYDVKASRSDGYVFDDVSEENLQYLSDDVKEMIKKAKDPHNDKVVDVFEGGRQGSQPGTTKAKLSSSNLRLLLLYDLLSRDAKRQRLSDYSGFSPDVMKALVESSSGTASDQLKMALAKMVERHDCGHEYANNRAKEMVVELGKNESGLSTELRYLQPLVYSY